MALAICGQYRGGFLDLLDGQAMKTVDCECFSKIIDRVIDVSMICYFGDRSTQDLGQ